MLTRTLYKNGNSIAVTIPRHFLDELQLKEGSKVVVKKNGEELVIVSEKCALSSDVDPKFMKMVDEFIHEHEDVLKKISKHT